MTLISLSKQAMPAVETAASGLAAAATTMALHHYMAKTRGQTSVIKGKLRSLTRTQKMILSVAGGAVAGAITIPLIRAAVQTASVGVKRLQK